MDNHCSFHNINYTPKQTKSPPNFSAKNTSFQISADNILNFYSNHFSLSIIQTKKNQIQITLNYTYIILQINHTFHL